jgi:5-methylcytosine-specific restriction enzyme MrcB-like protein
LTTLKPRAKYAKSASRLSVAWKGLQSFISAQTTRQKGARPQGTNAPRKRAEELARQISDELIQDAAIRDILDLCMKALGSDARLPGDYAAGHAMGITYTLNALPDEGTLQADVRNIVRAYRALTFRGGIEGDTEPQSDLSVEFHLPPQTYHGDAEVRLSSQN